MTKFYVDQSGAYLGAWTGPIIEVENVIAEFDHPDVPVGALEVPTGPGRATDIWTDGAWVEVPIVPISVTPLQARKALTAFGIRSQVEAYFASVDRTQAEKDEWHYATEVRYDDPVLAAAAATLGITDEQRAALFIAAGNL